jgi:hypothetical protein
MELEDKDLSLNYRTHCDPRLNYEQSLGELLVEVIHKVHRLTFSRRRVPRRRPPQVAEARQGSSESLWCSWKELINIQLSLIYPPPLSSLICHLFTRCELCGAFGALREMMIHEADSGDSTKYPGSTLMVCGAVVPLLWLIVSGHNRTTSDLAPLHEQLCVPSGC